jgi:hypothetical protein
MTEKKVLRIPDHWGEALRAAHRWEWLIFGLFLAASLFEVFRFAFLSHFGSLFGDSIDGMIETSILEHWWNVIRGFTRWRQTFYFYPTRGTLGYNDGYLLYGVVYSIFRAGGLDPFLSSELVNMVMKAVGFIGFAAFARRVLRLPLWAATLGAAVFTTSDNSFYQGSHVQLFTVALAPVEALFLAMLAAAIWRGERLRAGVAGVAAAVLLAAWFLTSFYMAWFFVLFGAILLPVLAVWAGLGQLQRFMQACRRCWAPLLVSVAVLLAGLLPTALIYLPVQAQAGTHSFAEMANYLLPPLDVLNIGAHNLMWGSLDGPVQRLLPNNSELATGFTPILLAVFVLSLLTAAVRRWIIPAALGTAAVLCWMLAVRVGDWSAWRFVFAYAPAGSVIRVVARLQLFLDWPVVSVAFAGLARLPSLSWRRYPTGAGMAGVLALLLYAEQANGTRIPALDRRAELDVFGRVEPPPGACRAFFALNAGSPDPGFGPYLRGLVQHNVDAMIVAEWRHLPTINGFATKLPNGWDLLSADQPDYRDRVHSYAKAHGLLPTLCALDMQTGRWDEHPFPN